MSQKPTPTPEETLAAKRYGVINLVRIGSIAAVVLGIAIAQKALDLPYVLGVGLALAGLIAFFFGPALLAKRWKASDRSIQGDRGEE